MSLEDDFKKALEDNVILINAKLSQASALLDEALTISEEHGIPFYSSISHLGQQYTPASFKKLWGELDDQVLENNDIYIDEYANGWAHSAVC